jgi:hypothetical protein
MYPSEYVRRDVSLVYVRMYKRMLHGCAPALAHGYTYIHTYIHVAALCHAVVAPEYVSSLRALLHRIWMLRRNACLYVYIDVYLSVGGHPLHMHNIFFAMMLLRVMNKSDDLASSIFGLGQKSMMDGLIPSCA